jgi:PAS domain S-box-containing protein
MGSTDLPHFGNKERHLQVSDNVTAMLAYWDKNLVCRFANDAYQDWFGKSKEEMVDKMKIHELLGPLYEMNLPYIKGALSGEKQVFEREIPVPGGGVRHSLATYIPDVADNDVMGFFVHVADVSHIKKPGSPAANQGKEMLRIVIEAQESERIRIASTLKDNVNQTLAYCKMILESNIGKPVSDELNQHLVTSLYDAIHEINILSDKLVPAGIVHLGFITGMHTFIDDFQLNHHVQINFECKNESIEELSINDKIAVFRIIESFLMMLCSNHQLTVISIYVNYEASRLFLRLSNNDTNFVFQKERAEWQQIRQRVEYFDGEITIIQKNEETELIAELPVKKSKSI